MKYFYTLLFLVCSFQLSQSQTITFTDLEFKNYLVNEICADLDNDTYVDSDVDSNNDGEIQVSEAQAVFLLEINQNCNATILDGLSEFSNLNEFRCINSNVINLNLEFITQIGDIEISDNNNLLSIDLSQFVVGTGNVYCNSNPQLETIDLHNLESVGRSLNFSQNGTSSNLLTDLDLSSLQSVNSYLFITYNNAVQPISIDLSSLTNVNQLLQISYNNLGSIDLSNLTTIHGLYFRYNTTITNLNLGNVISNDFYFTSSDDISIQGSSLTNINLQNLEYSVERIVIGNSVEIMEVNLDALVEVDGDITLTYNSAEVNLPSLEDAGVTIAGDIQSISLPSLINGGVFVNTDNDDLNSIDLSSLTTGGVNLNNNQLTSLNLSNLVNATEISATNNQLVSIDLSSLETASSIKLNNNQLNQFILNGVDLGLLNLAGNALSSLVLESVSLSSLYIFDSQLNELDLSTVLMNNLIINNDPSLTYLNLKNGQIINDLMFADLPNLVYICADNEEEDFVNSKLIEFDMTNCIVNYYCSFVPGGRYYSVEGLTNNDLDNNGCEVTDLPFPNMNYHITNGDIEATIISDETGGYSVSVQEGAHTITPLFENMEYYDINPSNLTVDFPVEVSPYSQNFCVTPNGIHNDLEVFIVPITDAIPGFNSEYRIVYRNTGTTILSGNVTFNYSFDNDYMEYVGSIPSETSVANNILSWDYMDLAPFEIREIITTFTLNTPTDSNFPLDSGDELNFEAIIYPLQDDETPNNNDFGLKQIVVNSFDPNDIRCLEGETIAPERVGEFVHYVIRFENLGTANATNIVVKNTIDDVKFDINSLVPLNGSHDYYTRINAQNDVEFIFENINLPFDDATNDGYVLYKIKTLESLVLGDDFSNQAEIYFDFNAPIITNTYITEIAEDQLSTNEFGLLNIKIHPNPVNDILIIESAIILNSASIYDINGRAILTSKFNDASHQMDLSHLEAGIYFLKVFSNSGSDTLKIIKE
nr:T9SS type A sorting domain-containing protein [uncultured Psychroserpens sp.]